VGGPLIGYMPGYSPVVIADPYYNGGGTVVVGGGPSGWVIFFIIVGIVVVCFVGYAMFGGR
jgi:hypothetical protein